MDINNEILEHSPAEPKVEKKEIVSELILTQNNKDEKNIS